MKKILMFAVLLSIFVACSKENDFIENNETGGSDETTTTEENILDVFSKDYSVVGEDEISSEELYLSSVSSWEDSYGISILDSLKDAFDDAEKKMNPIGSRSDKIYYKTIKLTYTTKDESDKDVKVSALAIYPLNMKIDKILLINHGTSIGEYMIPSYNTVPEKMFSSIGALCIMPDYIGIADSNDHSELYLNADVSGRTSTDALLVLMTMARKMELPIEKEFDTYVIGYSQGGAVSLATLKKIQELPEEQQNALRLKKVICGDGPYDLKATFETYKENDRPLGLPAVVPRVLNSMFNSYPDNFSKYSYEDFFTSKTLATGVPQAISSNQATALDMILKLYGRGINDILDMEYLTANKDAYDTFIESMSKQDLCTGWKPAYPLQFFHCNPDGIVPYVNFENAYEGLNNEYVLEPDTPKTSSMMTPLFQHIYGWELMIYNFLKGKYY